MKREQDPSPGIIKGVIFLTHPTPRSVPSGAQNPERSFNGLTLRYFHAYPLLAQSLLYWDGESVFQIAIEEPIGEPTFRKPGEKIQMQGLRNPRPDLRAGTERSKTSAKKSRGMRRTEKDAAATKGQHNPADSGKYGNSPTASRAPGPLRRP